jgi:AmiR/NasT family two-component response regulator
VSKALRVVLADDEPDLIESYRAMLLSLGHNVVAIAENGEELIARCEAAKPDLVITDIRMPRMDGIEAVLEAFRVSPMRVILVTGFHAPEHISSALGEMVLAYLSKPFDRRDLESAIERAEQRFEEFQALSENGEDPQQAVGNREVLRVAKGILMKRELLGDRSAFHRLRHLAREREVPLVEMARLIIEDEGKSQDSQEASRPDAQVTNCL